jgi:hypothetical protein
MEALGVASGAAGILSLGIAVCQGLLQYYGSWKDAESEVAGMYESIEALTHILLLLLPVIEHRDLDRNVVALIENHIASCQQGIEQLRKKLDKVKITPLQPGSRGKAKTQFWKTLYPFKESTLIKLKGIGNELRDQLSLSLDVLHIDASTASLTKLDILSQYVTEVSTDVTFLKQKSGLLSSNINTLSNSVEKSSIGVDALILGQSNEYLLKVFRWFSPLLGDFERKQLDTFNLKARQGGVGKWLLETQKFNDWFLGNGEILWCPGKRKVPSSLGYVSSSPHIQSIYPPYKHSVGVP